MTSDDDIAALREAARRYRSMSAPDSLARKVLTESGGSHRDYRAMRRRSYAFGAIAATALIVFIAGGETPPDPVRPAMPSLSALAGAVPDKPRVPVPGLGSLRTVKSPPAPAKPAPFRRTNETTDNNTTGRIARPQENRYEFS